MMKKKLSVAYMRKYTIGTSFPRALNHHLPRMAEIYHGLFEVDEEYDLNNLLKYRGDTLKLGLFFDKKDKLCGFAIAGIQTIRIDNKTHALFSAGAYADLNYMAANTVVKFALLQSIKYKLKHPSHQLAYLEEALSPAPFSLSSTALPECYPSPYKDTPNVVKRIIEQVKEKRGYILSETSDWVVKFPIKRKLKDYQRLLNSKKRQYCEYYQYYFQLNPKFTEGEALLVYMPLSFKNIVHAGLRLIGKR